MAENLKTLYYFTKAEHAFSNINEEKIKVSDIAKLNDTFDIFTPASKIRQERALANQFVREQRHLGGLICMSESWRSPLMWGHYADSHEGVCIGFELDVNSFTKVEYIRSRLGINHFEKSSFSELGDNDLLKMMNYKFSAWSYEQEYRYFVYRREMFHENNIDFLRIENLFRPKQFILGARCKLSAMQNIMASKYQEQGMEVFRARSAFRSFRMVKDRLWKLNA